MVATKGDDSCMNSCSLVVQFFNHGFLELRVCSGGIDVHYEDVKLLIF